MSQWNKVLNGVKPSPSVHIPKKPFEDQNRFDILMDPPDPNEKEESQSKLQPRPPLSQLLKRNHNPQFQNLLHYVPTKRIQEQQQPHQHDQNEKLHVNQHQTIK